MRWGIVKCKCRAILYVTSRCVGASSNASAGKLVELKSLTVHAYLCEEALPGTTGVMAMYISLGCSLWEVAHHELHRPSVVIQPAKSR
eukprot:2862311-Amphidinium_carterae.2